MLLTQKLINKIRQIESILYCFQKGIIIGRGSIVPRKQLYIFSKRHIIIGKNTILSSNLRIECIFNYGDLNFNPYIIIGDNVCINQNLHCTCANSIKIGNGTSITANCGIFDINHPYEDIKLSPRECPIKTDPIEIGDDCLIGMNSVIMPGVKLGQHCIIGCNSTVIKGEYPLFSVLVGSPAHIIKRYDFENRIWRKTDSKGAFI